MKELFQVLAGAMGQEQRLAQIANNLANINTPGFRQARSAFTDYLTQAAQTQGGSPSASPPANPAQTVWPVLEGTYLDNTAGPIQVTGQPLDVAIEGDGFFPVEVPGQAGSFYTRAGNFTLNANHELTTADGHRVLDGGGRAITLDLTQGAPSIGTDGTIRIGSTQAGQLGVVRFANPGVLQPYGEGLLQAPAGVQPQAVATPTLRSGAVEGSNVNAIQSMIEMIETERAYQSHQRVMQAIDDLVAERIQAAR